MLAVLSRQESNAINDGNASFTSEQVAAVIQNMNYDELVELIEGLSANIDSELLASKLQSADPRELEEFLSEAGEKMKTDMHAYINVKGLLSGSSDDELWF